MNDLSDLCRTAAQIKLKGHKHKLKDLLNPLHFGLNKWPSILYPFTAHCLKKKLILASLLISREVKRISVYSKQPHWYFFQCCVSAAQVNLGNHHENRTIYFNHGNQRIYLSPTHWVTCYLFVRASNSLNGTNPALNHTCTSSFSLIKMSLYRSN